jgi:Fur family transcriptional regulator, ferric uptake regulator
MNPSRPTAARLRAQGYRMTSQRLVILQILEESRCHLTPAEVFSLAQEQLPGLTETTVYRTLSFLVEQGLALAAHVGGGQLVYEFAERNHHHLICRACRHTHEIDHSVLQKLYERFQQDTGFQIDSYHVTFFGLCPECLRL